MTPPQSPAPQAEAAEPVAQPDGHLHDDGYFTWAPGKRPPYDSNYAGWHVPFYLSAPLPRSARKRPRHPPTAREPLTEAETAAFAWIVELDVPSYYKSRIGAAVEYLRRHGIVAAPTGMLKPRTSLMTTEDCLVHHDDIKAGTCIPQKGIDY